MIRISLILFFLLPAIIYSQPDYLKKEYKFSSQKSIGDNDTKLYKKYHIKSVTKWKADGNGDNIRIEMTEFDINGNITNWMTYDTTGKKVINLKYEYNSKGLTEKMITQYYNGYPELNSAETFTYDDKRRLIKFIMENKTNSGSDLYQYNDSANSYTIVEIDKNNTEKGRIETFYNDNDYTVSVLDNINHTITNYNYFPGYVDMIMSPKNKPAERTRIKFDDKNQVTEKSRIDEDSSIHVQYATEYNSSGKETKDTGFDDSGKEVYRYERKYDDNGNAIEEDYYSFDRLENKEIYKYNEKGLIIEKAEKNKISDVKNERILYSYEYYKK